jgi:hypothetical protein
MCYGNCSRNGSRRGIFLRNLLGINSTSSTPCDKVVARCPISRPVLEILRYAPHQITQKLKVKKFEFGLIVRIQLILWVPGIRDRRKCVGLWVATLPTLFPRGRGWSIWISRAHYCGSFGQGPLDSYSGE